MASIISKQLRKRCDGISIIRKTNLLLFYHFVFQIFQHILLDECENKSSFGILWGFPKESTNWYDPKNRNTTFPLRARECSNKKSHRSETRQDLIEIFIHMQMILKLRVFTWRKSSSYYQVLKDESQLYRPTKTAMKN